MNLVPELDEILTLGKIADVLQGRGELDEALRIYREEALPTFERLGDVQARAVTLAKLGMALAAKGERGEAQAALARALADARRLKIPEAEQIRELMERSGVFGNRPR